MEEYTATTILHKRVEATNKVWQTWQHKEEILREKSKAIWIREGDSNSKYFHAIMKRNFRRNAIMVLGTYRGFLSHVDEVECEIFNHFQQKLFEPESNRQKLLGVNFRFYKKCWEVIKDDLLDFVMKFHWNAILPKAVTASSISLIQKPNNPEGLNNHHLICQIGSVYRILAKLLTDKLKKVISGWVSSSQLEFIQGRKMLDGVLVINEQVDLAKRKKNDSFLFKFDFEKAYNCVA
ncbi:uncharacterized protein LOC127135714 [Lathyrus oleraceus]|uniref:uncharacterized protein LOC127135714 n=1 Tax=Pisum sativum TaxID=3888 RepID=UPI0021D275BA|nr:uncharacterized protein LOC127135714 [Pisum sativum]